MHTIFLSANDCTVSEWEFVLHKAGSKASSITEKFKSVHTYIYIHIDIYIDIFVGVITKEST